MSSSLPHPMNPSNHKSLDKCSFCNTHWGCPTPNGAIEQPALLPCGHIFGADCLLKHMSSGLKNWDHTDFRRCPDCDQTLWYRGCKHTVEPQLMIISATESGERVLEFPGDAECRPQSTRAHHMPPDCPGCGPAMLPLRRKVVELKRSIADLGDKAADPRNCFAQQIMFVKNLSLAEAEIEELKPAVDAEWVAYEASRRGW